MDVEVTHRLSRISCTRRRARLHILRSIARKSSTPSIRRLYRIGMAFENAEQIPHAGRHLNGGGDKAFIAGADITEWSRDGSRGERICAPRPNRLDLIENLGKASDAAVNGFALGGGCETECLTIRLATEDAKFGQPEVKLDSYPGPVVRNVFLAW